MTLLGILFVLGVAFMASMNFASQQMASESLRDDGDHSATTMSEDMGSMMHAMMMSAPGVPFSADSLVDSGGNVNVHGAYAEMPGVQNSFSAIEPLPSPGPDGLTGTTDDLLNHAAFPAYVNPATLHEQKSSAPSPSALIALVHDPQAKNFGIPTSLPPGSSLPCWPLDETMNPPGCIPPPIGMNLQRCVGGPNDGLQCDTSASQCNNFPCEGPRLLDADGDGVADSIAVDARELGFSESQLATLSVQLNPKSKPNGRVLAAFRIIPHGGMVDLNASHPKLIENALNVPDLHAAAGPAYGNFTHGPSAPARGNDPQYAYPPTTEERMLRRRNILPPMNLAPSRLFGNSLASAGAGKNFQADMGWQLFGPKPTGAGTNYYSVDPNDPLSHRYWPFSYTVTSNSIHKEAFVKSNLDLPAWEVRMEPLTAQNNVGMDYYNRSHLTTTVSYDSLLHRGGRMAITGGSSSPQDDLLSRMTSANYTADASDPTTCLIKGLCKGGANAGKACTSDPYCSPGYCEDVLPFEYADYPQTISDCCPTDPSCKPNPRKGRLQLSLTWLQPTCTGGSYNGQVCHVDADCGGGAARCEGVLLPPANSAAANKVARAQHVIYDAFFMMLNNALSTPYFEDVDCSAAPCASAGEYCDATATPHPICRDMWTNQKHSINQLTRTAASLTANLIDYADNDEVPTRIAIRNLNFDDADARCEGGGSAGMLCKTVADCGGAPCTSKLEYFGRDMLTCDGGINADKVCKTTDDPIVGCPGATCSKRRYMYGLEKQPFITEVAAYVEGPVIKGWAFELFNPYVDFPAGDEYWLYQVSKGAIAPGAPIRIYTANKTIPNGFSTFITGDAGIQNAMLGTPPKVPPTVLAGVDSLSFQNGSTLYLVRQHTFPGDPNPTDIVLDQFEVKGTNIAQTPCTPGPICYNTLERDVQRDPATDPRGLWQWRATVPRTGDERDAGGTGIGLGTWTDKANAPTPPPQPVEVSFSNSGYIARPLVLNNADNHAARFNVFPAFPTTGSMLLLMRHANRAMSDFYYAPSVGTPHIIQDLAFTTRLGEEPVIKVGTNPPVPVPEWKQIDNGRMPVFDVGVEITSTIPPAHYVMHHVLPKSTALNAPGELYALPWGQLVFDYFTALPLSNSGPYFDVFDPTSNVAAPASQPRVDLDGLRIQGRVNLNAAPWKVLAGLPLVPMENFSNVTTTSNLPLRDRVKQAVHPTLSDGTDAPDEQAGLLHDNLAQAIVAYRDLRAFAGSGNYDTGDRDAGGPTTAISYGRGWALADPATRRGTGFSTVGELANVRHPGSFLTPGKNPNERNLGTYPIRFDAGNIDPDPNASGTDYVSAIATLVALGDWVTVRSDVYTVYGVLRGEDDTDLAAIPATPALQERLLMSQDADSRAIRFQETIDRLPTLLGEPKPRRIGQRVISAYSDYRND